MSQLAYSEVNNQVEKYITLAGESTSHYNSSENEEEFQHLLFEAKDSMDKVQFLRKHANGKRVERNVLGVIGLIFAFTGTMMTIRERKRKSND